MTKHLALLCPGQGGQHARMFDILDNAARATTLLAQWSIEEKINLPLNTALSNPSALFSNRIAQPLIVAATLATWETLKPALPLPVIVAGYSIGELSSYAVAGAITPPEALSLAAVRACLMDSCGNDKPQGLLAVSGMHLSSIADSATRAGLFVAIETGADSAIVGGLREHALAYEQELLKTGCTATLLPVGIASHTPLMTPAVAPFLEELHRMPFADPDHPVVAGVSSEVIRRKADAIGTLARQLDQTIRWKDCMDACAEAGVTIALELGPGAALSNMMRRAHPHIDCRSVTEFRSLEGIRKWVDRHFDE
ncbi:MAG TPA: acyltransferase domain-containing protein [Noviherbaspirillum sp.]|jgi:[acyl-carrier-protein] S-malonyltransferase|uniref:ACP S-malonyltransferase n=1 Tax=Noviherbaspirillum sp. TaxID=1926288 RepID=UPI002DDDA4CB|nr:acyltransferase domain-containing protein [Noviherbaspirillum sp.]HEV2609736.1 acyltransferase domain-containing protein [Noviherbaspirillum sp.]